MKFNKKEKEVLRFLANKAEEGVGLFNTSLRTSYNITIWGKGRAKALRSVMNKITERFDLKETP